MKKKTKTKSTIEVSRDDLASIELVHPVRDVLGREVSRFTEADASWAKAIEAIEVKVGSAAADVLLGGPPTAPKTHTVMMPGYSITQPHPTDPDAALRLWVPISGVSAARIPLRRVEAQDDSNGGWLRATEARAVEAERKAAAELARGEATV